MKAEKPNNKKKRREDMVAAGAYDGRFKQKVVRDRKKYSRKTKHKKL